MRTCFFFYAIRPAPGSNFTNFQGMIFHFLRKRDVINLSCIISVTVEKNTGERRTVFRNHTLQQMNEEDRICRSE